MDSALRRFICTRTFLGPVIVLLILMKNPDRLKNPPVPGYRRLPHLEHVSIASADSAGLIVALTTCACEGIVGFEGLRLVNQLTQDNVSLVGEEFPCSGQ